MAAQISQRISIIVKWIWCMHAMMWRRAAAQQHEILAHIRDTHDMHDCDFPLDFLEWYLKHLTSFCTDIPWLNCTGSSPVPLSSLQININAIGFNWTVVLDSIPISIICMLFFGEHGKGQNSKNQNHSWHDCLHGKTAKQNPIKMTLTNEWNHNQRIHTTLQC